MILTMSVRSTSSCWLLQSEYFCVYSIRKKHEIETHHIRPSFKGNMVIGQVHSPLNEDVLVPRTSIVLYALEIFPKRAIQKDIPPRIHSSAGTWTWRSLRRSGWEAHWSIGVGRGGAVGGFPVAIPSRISSSSPVTKNPVMFFCVSLNQYTSAGENFDPVRYRNGNSPP